MNTLDLATRNVERLWTDRHAWLMYGLVRWLQPRSVVEVGAWHGFCTMHLAQALKDSGGGQITVIDDFSLGNAASTLHNNLASIGCADMLTILSGKSAEVVWPKKVDFAFIDGDHSFEGCLHDCNKSIEAGAQCLCIHDTQGWWGPMDYVETFREQAKGTWDVIESNFDSGFAVLLKREPKTAPFYTEKDYPKGCV